MVTLTVETNETAILTVESAEMVMLEAETVIAIPGETYTGSYEFTPSDTAQIISIMGMTATQDITIDPIPSNYGLITWNGSTLTVS